MKVITLEELQNRFDEIMDDIGDNNQFYRLQTEKGDFMLVPATEFNVLAETYDEWAEETKIDPFDLPFQYIGEAEPRIAGSEI